MKRLLPAFLAFVAITTGCAGALPLLPRVNVHWYQNRTNPAAWSQIMRAGGEVAWLGPLPDGDRGGAWAGVETRCDSPPPVAWSIVAENGEETLAGEIRRISSGDTAAPHEITPYQAAGVIAKVPVRLEERVRWLLVRGTEEGGHILLKWDRGADERVGPCQVRWEPIEMAAYLAATEAPGTEIRKDRAGATPDTQAPEEEGTDGAARALGLLGRPDYDLQVIHQAALGVEFGGALPAGVGKEAIGWLRLERLQRIESEANAIQRLCYLGLTRGLFNLRLSLWNGDATIPLRHKKGCDEG